jgi:outer membrane protein OmpA-like peptidoglycan-associated protein
MYRRMYAANLEIRIAVSLAALGAAFGLSNPVFAQERHIGTFEIQAAPNQDGDRLEPPASYEPRSEQAFPQRPNTSPATPLPAEKASEPAPAATPSRSGETAALFDQAEAALETGDTLRAQRLLEQLVARYPDGADSSAARKLLADLYRGVKPEIAAKKTETKDPATPPTPAVETAPATPQAGSTPPVAPPQAAGPSQSTVTPPSPPTGDSANAAKKDPNAKPVIPKMLSQDKNERYDAPRNTELEKKFRVEAGDRIFFSAGSAELGARARTALLAQARWLVARTDVEVLIEGHADEPGSDQDNKIISQQRAEAVRARLIEEGVAAERIAVKALGRKERVATCLDPECRVQNRRAVTVVFPMPQGQRQLPKAPAQTTSVLPVQPMAVSGADVINGGATTAEDAGAASIQR